MNERLQKILARAGVCSRRKAEELILAGRVRVDGRLVKELGSKADPVLQKIEVDGRPLGQAEEKVYYLLNKPAGYVTTLHDPQGRPVIMELMGGVTVRIFPVGRLDQDTEGALLLTNDGEFAQQVLHPRFEIKRTYEATVRGTPAGEVLRALAEGVVLEGRKTWPAKVRMLRVGQNDSDIEIVIHEGRKRQVRKMCRAVGHPVLRLKRTAYGGLRLGNLPAGQYRQLEEKDLNRIFSRKKTLYNK